MNSHFCRNFTFFLFFFLLQNISQSWAQMTILNVPSADVTPKKRVFFQHESQFRTKEKGQFTNSTEYLATGIGANTELTATAFNLGNLSHDNETLGLGFKSAIPLNISAIKEYQPKIIISSQAALSLSGNGVRHWIYAAYNFTIPQTKTRLTLGASNGTKHIFGENNTSAMLGFEQKITTKLSYVGDWYSGKTNGMGVFASALSYDFGSDLVAFAGYQIANSNRISRNGFIVEIAKTF